jgi:hypothetical protein
MQFNQKIYIGLESIIDCIKKEVLFYFYIKNSAYYFTQLVNNYQEKYQYEFKRF